MRRLVASLSLLALPAIARSDDETDKRTETDEPTAADVAGAPLPGQESGRTDAIRTEESRLHEVVRGVLVFPRAAVELVLVPVRGTLWAYERYAVPDRFRDTFYDHTHTYGLYPTLHVDATYGVTFGGRFVHRDLLGDRERFSLRAGLGGEFRQLLDASATSGNRLGDHMASTSAGRMTRSTGSATTTTSPTCATGSSSRVSRRRSMCGRSTSPSTCDWRAHTPTSSTHRRVKAR
jgi:hypothetical protein